MSALSSFFKFFFLNFPQSRRRLNRLNLTTPSGPPAPPDTFALAAHGAAAESRGAGEGVGRAPPAAGAHHEGTCRAETDKSCRGAAGPGSPRPGRTRPSPSPAGHSAPPGAALASARASSAAGRSGRAAAAPMGSVHGGTDGSKCARGGGRRPLGAAPVEPRLRQPGGGGETPARRGFPACRRDPRTLPGSVRRPPVGASR